MEDGTVLQPGRSDFFLAYGRVPRPKYDCGGYAVDFQSDGTVSCTDYSSIYGYGQSYNSNQDFSSSAPKTPSLVWEQEQHFAMGWRLGVLDKFGPFTGLEVGIQTEAATNPVSQEYKVAIGLPGSDSSVAHSLIGGWGTGMWADNEWFLQYAASKRFGSWRWFGSLRTTLQATQLQDLFSRDNFLHHRTWDTQAALGVKVQLGEIPIIPDWMAFGITADLSHAGYPSFQTSKMGQESGMGVAWATTMGWSW